MGRVSRCPVPLDSLLARFDPAEGHHTDAFAAEVRAPVPLAAFIGAFYATPLFRIERALLRLGGFPVRDGEVAELAAGTSDRFAAWRVEDRHPDQILLRDVSGRTGSWLGVEPDAAGGTRLWFGSVVTPKPGGRGLGAGVRVLMGFHLLYSRALLASARNRLSRQVA